MTVPAHRPASAPPTATWPFRVEGQGHWCLACEQRRVVCSQCGMTWAVGGFTYEAIAAATEERVLVCPGCA